MLTCCFESPLMKNKKRSLVLFFSLFLVVDAGYSFMQFYTTPLDGDMSESIVPAGRLEALFADPFGFNTLTTGALHQNPNRYFAHVSLREYFRNLPLLLQKVTTPVESIYVSTALIKLLIQLLIIYLLSVLIRRKISVFDFDFLLVAVLLTPLFQALGYNRFMGIIDQAVTYTFFYALPLLLLLLFFTLLHPVILQRRQLLTGYFRSFTLIALIVILPFSGPLIPPVVLIVSFLLAVFYVLEYFNRKTCEHSLKGLCLSVPRQIYLFLIPLAILSLYSVWLGTYNIMSQTETLPLIERYQRLPKGIFRLVSQKVGFPVLFIMLGINITLIKKGADNQGGKRVISILRWIGLFCLLYTLLLPLGGYRSYRVNIIRYDTIMPVTLCLFYGYGISTYFLLKQFMSRKKTYSFAVIAVALIFTIGDLCWLNENECEKNALIELSQSEADVFPIGSDCKIVSWRPIHDYQASKLNAEMLLIWNITDELRLYYNE